MALLAADARDGRFALAICDDLACKGFSVLDFACDASSVTKLQAELDDLAGEQSNFEAVAPQLLPGLLGPEPAQVHHLPHPDLAAAKVDSSGPLGMLSDLESIAALDAEMTKLAMILGPAMIDTMQLPISSRSPALLLETGSAEKAATSEALSMDRGLAWLELFRLQRLMVVVFLGPQEGVLELRPEDTEATSFKVRTSPGMWMVLRPDLLERNFKSSGGMSRAVACWFLGEHRRKELKFVKELETFLVTSMEEEKQFAANEEEFLDAVARRAQHASNHLFRSGMRVALRGVSANFPVNTVLEDDMWLACLMGTDAGTTVPLARWDIAAHWVAPWEFDSANERNPQGQYTMTLHGSFIDGADLFDNKFFGVSVSESRIMDPNQHLILECAYAAFHSAGLAKPNLIRKWCGVYTAASFPEWNNTEKTGTTDSTGGSLAISSNRVSYQLGLTGPNFSMNLEGAGALLALTVAADTLLPGRNQNDTAIVLGSELIMSSIQWHWLSLTRRMSTRGGCFSFDASADGFIRSEGCGGVYLERLAQETDSEATIDESKTLFAVIEGAHSVNVGKSAQLGAPSGPADQSLICDTLRKACISPLDVDALECFGIGNRMHDAIECMAASCAYRRRDQNTNDDVLALTSIKSNIGFGVPVAGLQSLLKVLGMLQTSSIVSGIHLHQLNPVLDLAEASVVHATENLASRLPSSSFVGITAKGWGGTLAHVVLWGQRRNESDASITDPAKDMITYWPGGGGDLPGRSKPRKGYFISGSWGNWEPEEMKESQSGIYTSRVKLSEDGFVLFQIVLDGDMERVLHPGREEGAKGCLVCGPDATDIAAGNAWIIDGRTTLFQRRRSGVGEQEYLEPANDGATADELGIVPVSSLDQGSPGDEYEVSLHVNGKYRMVTWLKLAD
mmetsp:Transcript_22584/g.52613  ORF Transcript_22584/g.52613 Transcript_22584/m.52613 type:complete len:906 (+) Transcript_22584:153-2870(+)